MGLRGRTVSIFLATIAVSTVMAVLVSQFFYLRGFSGLEEAEASSMLTRTQALIDDDLDQLEIIVRDWAVWDDAFDFMHTGSESFIAATLLESTLEGLGLSGILFLTNDASVRFSSMSDPEAFDALYALYVAPAVDQPIQGIRQVLGTSSGLHLVAGHPILPSNMDGPAAGMLIMLRPLDYHRTDRYSRLLGATITVTLPSLRERAYEGFEKSSDALRAFNILRDVDNEAVASVAIELPRTIMNHGYTSLVYYLSAVAVTLGLIALASLHILETMVFRHLRNIGTQLGPIVSGSDPGARVHTPGGDEIGALANMMNRSLDALQTRIQERETMLREIHHRVKNNLQIIASLLNLQAVEAENPSSSHALNEGRRRVLAMAFIHDELYSEADLATIDLGHFLDGFIRFFEPERTGYGAISRRLVTEGLSIDIDQAVPVGLILSEALANCYQHAFPGCRDGSIVIEAKANGMAGFTIEVQDDGGGLNPDGFHRSGLGLSLIDALTDQLHGRVSLEPRPEGGTVLRLDFPKSREQGHT